jgi:putative oxidoreductase
MSSWNKFLQNDYLNLLVRIAVGTIFIYASCDKIFNPGQFARIVYNYHLLPTDFINIFALILPWAELICGISIILGIYKDGGVLMLNLILVSFIIALGVNLIRGVDIECGCFTVSSKAKSGILGLLLRDFGLFLLTLYLFFNRSPRFSIMGR